MSKEKKGDRSKKPRIGAIVLWSLLALVVVAIIVMSKAKPREEDVAAIPEKAALVHTLSIAPRAIDDMVVLPGKVAADRTAQLAAEKNGRIVALNVDRGDSVKAGQALLRFDSRVWEVYGKRASIELADAEKDLARWEKLKGEGAVSSSEYDAIKRRRDLASVAVEEAAVHVSQCQVVSPIDGVVDARYVEQGEHLVEGQPVFRIVDRTELNVILNVPERDIGAVKKDMQVTMRSDALPSLELIGRVDFIAPAGDPVANTFVVELAVIDPPSELRPGMIVDVDLLRGVRDNAIVVPLASVIPKRGEHVAFVVEAERAVLRVVRIDAIVGEDVVVASGLQAGDRLVVEGHRTLQDGVPVFLATDASTEPVQE